MYVNPFVAGVVVTLFAEMAIFIVVAIIKSAEDE